MGATGPKRTPIQREADRRDIATLARSGHTQVQIAKAISAQRPYDLSRAQVGRDLSATVARWRVEASADIQEIMADELARIAYAESQLWEEWHASMEDLVSEREVVYPNGQRRRTTRRMQRIGDPRILEAILRCGTRRFDLLGLIGRDRRSDSVVPSSPAQGGGLVRRVDELVEVLVAANAPTAGTSRYRNSDLAPIEGEWVPIGDESLSKDEPPPVPVR